jgi:hypothetical protein
MKFCVPVLHINRMLEDSESNSSSGANIRTRLQLSSFCEAHKSAPANSSGIFKVIGGVAVRGAVGGINYETNPNSSQLIKEAASNSNGMNSSRKVDKALI